ncbi:putative ABC bile acid transporter [Aspergillus clavatus NRRL 1]|uniref:ABC bile acid transporter, putative n=1 Tax=Aspergillus clavatus (strain ATCC 1007 / CBS 513.65 / DSM 816 / NCTC 3887 / NRRL 1 / QM 1276 / 107) TaxID=344612 RepID=A1CGM5_ASPCL|nr:ABC bile acid transporter, putative [Aspergillus clavatus NRRL 1]EAW11105.1 ABC bile acid transporter, putative [Aspergillus clavatus NRRL 1]
MLVFQMQVIQGLVLTLTALLSIAAVRSLVSWLHLLARPRDQFANFFYEDRDGQAEGKAVQSVTRWTHRLVIAVLISFSCAMAISRAILIGLLLIQSIGLLVESSCIKRFSLGLQLACSCALATVSLAINSFGVPTNVVQSSLIGAECACQAVAILLSLLLPRRPDVRRNGVEVDRELSTSFLGRITFSWADRVLDLTKGQEIEVDELPELDYETRAHRLQESFNQARHAVATDSAPLWRTLLLSHRSNVISQLLLCIFQTLISFTPHLSLLQILRRLERRSDELTPSIQMWFWVAALSLSIVLSSSIESWLYWIAWNKVSVRVNEQISIAVFDKAMRLMGSNTVEPNNLGEENEAGSNRTQNTINLVAVDGQRIAEFATFSFHLLLSPLKMSIASMMLLGLLGWQSLLVGLSSLLILLPMITLCGRWYAAAAHELMSSRDRKMTILTEILRVIRQLKFSAWERKWMKRVQSARDGELRAQRRVFLANASTMSLYLLGPILLSIGSLGTYTIVHRRLTASVAFTAISILTSMAGSLGLLPELLSDLLDALVSMRRLDDFFAASEKMPILTPSDRIRFENACISWPKEPSQNHSPWTLEAGDLQFPPGKISLVMGRTGAGKSLLLASILGECRLHSGKIKAPVAPSYEELWSPSAIGAQWLIPSAVAYVAQLPWIEAATIKDNILFGLSFDRNRYDRVIFACALTKDLDLLPDGENTEVGPSGVNLSGGQKARIALARALYSRAGILILDDIFSAVDVHTARHLYDHALTGQLAEGRTRILATHQIGMCLSQTEYLVHLQNGNVAFAGDRFELENTGLLDSFLCSQPNIETLETATSALPEDMVQPNLLQASCPSKTQDGIKVHNTRRFVQKEIGRTKTSVPRLFLQYVNVSGSRRRWLLLVLGYLAYTLLSLSRNWWLRVWSQQDTTTSGAGSGAEGSLSFYLSLYIAIAACEWIVGSLRTCLVFMATLKASDTLFRNCLMAVLQAPLLWLDTVPLGQVLNRFTADFNVLDSRLCFELTYMLQMGTECLTIVLAGLLGNPWLIVPTIPLAMSCLFYARRYLTAAREVKRIENISRSPIYEQFNSSLSGLSTIRGFGRSDFYVAHMQWLIDRHARAFWHQWLLTRWLGIRMNILGAVFAACVAALVTTQPTIDAATAGFAISFTIQLSTALTHCIRLYTSLELAMNAVDRVMEYTNIEPESQQGTDPPAAWPTYGRLEVNDLTVRYAPDLAPVLSHLNFTVQGGQRVGIIGRTGAGKSSFALALFRFLEACEGRIVIDGIDISQVRLEHLRSRLAMIPQNPVLLSGTIRSNLDPFQEHDDVNLIGVLALVHGTAMDAGPLAPELDAPVSEGGLNLSQGQRQLICLARAMVSNPRVLILDEATSAVDQATDVQIQQALRARFGPDTTLLVIAHRLSTIVDFDRILVLDQGTAVEFGRPSELLSIPEGIFRGMVEQDAEREQLMEIIRTPSDPSAQDSERSLLSG